MPGSSNGGRSGNRNNGKKSESKQMLESLRGACPPHKKRDFDLLVKQLNGDETKIQQKIQEWWEEPQQPPEEEKWEDVNKKASAKQKYGGKYRGDRGGGRGSLQSSGGGAPGRGGRGGGRGRGGRGGRSGDRKFRDNDGGGLPPHKQQQNQQPAQRDESNKKEGSADQQPTQRVGVPKPVTNAPIPKGAWGRAPAVGPTTAPPSPEKPVAQPQQQQPQQPISAASLPPTKKEQTLVPVVEPADVGMVTKNDPTPSGLALVGESKPAPRAVAPVSGNVWATKGSAHLIQAENPKPPAPIPPASAPSVVQPVVSAVPPPTPVEKLEPLAPEPVEEAPSNATVDDSVLSTLESGLPPSVAMAPPPSTNSWGKEPASAAPTVSAPAPPLDIPPSPEAVVNVKSSPLSTSIASPVPSVEEPVASLKPQAPPPKPARPAPTNVLNMGHWETGDNEDSQNLDFGFGSFGTDNDVMDVGVSSAQAPDDGETAPAAPTTSTPPTSAQVPVTSAASTVSPARPPPGLSIGGMPPMPANAVLVHELEHSLENVSLNAPKPDQQAPAPQEKPITNPLPPQPSAQVPSVPTGAAAPVLPGQQNYNQYGMGMYNYNPAAAGSGFVGVHAPAGPFLAGVGVIPQQQQPPKVGGNSPQPGATPSGPSQNLPPGGGLYGHHASAPSSGNAPETGNASTDSNANNSNNANAAPAAAGMPPGMPNMPPYNPALYYGQQAFHLGQHQGGMGYSYGYGAQFGGVQGGFGYQQVMGQSGGYGAPHYGDDGQHQGGPPHQGNTHSHHTGGSGGYPNKSGGGYRGRNNHHNNNQYQNQYNPQQHGGYGGQPYGMGYHNDHFNQRGGYGHNMGDPYGMQQQQQQQGIHSGAGAAAGASGFQDDSDHHNKGRRGGNNRNNNNSSLQQFQGGPHGQLSAGQQQPFGLQGQSTDSAQTGTGAGGSGWSNNQGGGGWSGGASSWQQGGN